MSAPRFPTADKLALMLTSAGSQRALARYLGCSHQQVGRWLQGERINPTTGEVSNIPRDPAILANINTAFGQYRKAVHQAARRDGVPYTPEAPALAKRLAFTEGPQKGQPGHRIVIEHTQHMRPDLLQQVFTAQAGTGQYFEVSVRSTVELARYFKQGEDRYRGKRTGKTGERMLRNRESLKAKLAKGVMTSPIWTRRENVLPNVAPDIAFARVTSKIRQKHEPAAGAAGTVLADQIMFTQLPAATNGPSTKQTRKTSKPRKRK